MTRMSEETKEMFRERKAARTARANTQKQINAAQKRCDEWNEKYPPGTDVFLDEYLTGSPFSTKTRSVAWVASCQPLVLVEGKTGGYSLDIVTPNCQEIRS